MDSKYFIEHYQPDTQLEKLKEECLELVETIEMIQIEAREMKFAFPGLPTMLAISEENLHHFYEECADVQNLIDQFEAFEGKGLIYAYKCFKRARQYARIKFKQFVQDTKKRLPQLNEEEILDLVCVKQMKENYERRLQLQQGHLLVQACL